MSARLLLLRIPIRSATFINATCSLSVTAFSARQTRPILKYVHQAIRQSIRRASSSATPTPKPGASTTPPPSGRKYAYPENLLIYHAGTGRTTFIACLKLTTIFVFVFFGLVVTPAYVKSDHPLWHAGGVFACGLIPLLTVSYITAPFVTNIHIRPPVFARQSRDLLLRWSKSPTGITASTPLTVTTMSFIGKPRVSTMTVGDLVPVKKKFGLVNYLRRDVGEENARRKWYMFRAVGEFNVNPGGDRRVKNGTGFVWEAVERVVGGSNGVGGK